jgi:isocitrate dehydrogenase
MKMIKPQESRASVHKAINRSVVNKESIEAITKETDKKVEGTFINIEYPGQPAKITAKLYKGQELFKEVMEDGMKYTIPLSVARHINERCVAQEHAYVLDASGAPIKNPKPKPRYKFTIENYTMSY